MRLYGRRSPAMCEPAARQGLWKIREANAGRVVERGDAAVSDWQVAAPCCGTGRLGFSAAVAEPLGRARRAIISGACGALGSAAAAAVEVRRGSG